MYKSFFKRFFDLIIGIVGFPFFLLALIVFGPFIYATDKGPVFYNAKRIGKDGKLFTMYKFRSMKVNAPDIRNADGSTYNGEDDPRVTRIGHFLRATSIDELPQIINVLNGSMSLVGPRPDPPDDLKIYTEEQRRKLSVRPGITGYNQAYYRNSVEQEEKFKHDVYYADNISFVLDLKIVIKTITAVLKRESIYNTAAAPSEDTKRYLSGGYLTSSLLGSLDAISATFTCRSPLWRWA